MSSTGAQRKASAGSKLYRAIGHNAFMRLDALARYMEPAADVVTAVQTLIRDDHERMLAYRAGLARKIRGKRTIKAMSVAMNCFDGLIVKMESGQELVSDAYLSDLRAAARKK